MEYKPTNSSAKDFADVGKFEEWIHLFLCGEGGNKAFSDGLKIKKRRYHAPKLYALDTFKRICGPESDMKWIIDEIGFNERVAKIMERYKKGDWDMPPLIIENHDTNYELSDGNHRYEALIRSEIKEYWVIIWETVE